MEKAVERPPFSLDSKQEIRGKVFQIKTPFSQPAPEDSRREDLHHQKHVRIGAGRPLAMSTRREGDSLTTLRIIQISTADELASCWAVRREVFVDEQGVPEELEIDGDDPLCVHFAAIDDRGQVWATARLRMNDGEGKAQRVAVRLAARGKGVGTQVMRALEECARRLGAQRVKLSSQLQALPFYERLGYRAHGDIYDDAGIPHRDMTKML